MRERKEETKPRISNGKSSTEVTRLCSLMFSVSISRKWKLGIKFQNTRILDFAILHFFGIEFTFPFPLKFGELCFLPVNFIQKVVPKNLGKGKGIPKI